MGKRYELVFYRRGSAKDQRISKNMVNLIVLRQM